MELNKELGHDKSILVVEDDPFTNELISSLLEARGFKVNSVTTGEDAIEHLKSNQPDMIVLDLLLPQMDGWQVCQIIRKEGSKTAQTPIMVTSVLSRFETVLSDPQMKNVVFFGKPFESNDLINEVERILYAS